ncbi:hypothetical protein NT6N_24000 [Oceaniferula spumae]|uniref:Uncharacterized protein n=1 Tax=Oceaniferula spumae TaxID=2979115 RepID=A0AAT9FMW2_9BACT
MKTLITIIVILASSVFSQGEEYVIKPGLNVTEVVKALDKYGFSHGSQHGLQWAPKKGQRFVFCKLSDEQTLVIVYTIETKKIVGLLVVTNQTQRKSYPIVKPDVLSISKKSFSLTFKK